MASFKPTKIQVYPKLGEKVTQDTLYWKNYKAPVQIKEFGAVTSIDFSPVTPHNFAVTAFTRIHIYGPFSQEPVKSFTRFKDTAYCGRFRSDGQLLVAGCEDSVVRLFDVSGKVALRLFKGHTKAVHLTDFTSDRYQILTGSDDYTCRLWDIPNATELTTYREHTDYIRCGVTSKLNRDLFITGSYDHTVKLFDARVEKSVITMDHGQPVESVLLYPSEGLLVSAGGRHVKVWDLLKGGQPLVSLKNHHKTVTSLALSSNGQRLLSASLDRHVKVYSTTNYKVVHNFDYAASILSLALAPDDESTEGQEQETKPQNLTDDIEKKKQRKPKKISSDQNAITGFEEAFEQFATTDDKNSKRDTARHLDTLSPRHSDILADNKMDVSATQATYPKRKIPTEIKKSRRHPLSKPPTRSPLSIVKQDPASDKDLASPMPMDSDMKKQEHLWQNHSPNFLAEKAFNAAVAVLKPHCAVCSLFCPYTKRDVSADNETMGASFPRHGSLTRPLVPEMCFSVGAGNTEPPPTNYHIGEDGTSLLICCSSCQMQVHASCYGVKPDSVGDSWMCSRCAAGAWTVECCLCNLRGGALKTTTDNRWVHVICAIAVAEARFIDAIERGPVDVSAVPETRKNLKCVFCHGKVASQNRGACIQCTYQNCATSFHVTCAQIAGVVMTPADWPYVVSVTCHRHKKVTPKPRPTPKGPQEPTLGQRVIGRNVDSWYYHCTIIGMARQTFYEVNFDDGSYCDNLYPENIISHDCLRSGPPEVGELVVVSTPEGKILNASFVKQHIHKLYQVEFQDQSQLMVKHSEIFQLNQELPKRVRARLALPGTQEEVPSVDEAQAAKRRRLPPAPPPPGPAPANIPMETTNATPCPPTTKPTPENHSIGTQPTSQPLSQPPMTQQDAPAPASGIQMDAETPMDTGVALTDPLTGSPLTSDPLLSSESVPFQSTLNSDPLLSAPSPPPPPSQHMSDSYTPSSGYVSYMKTLLHSHFPQEDGPEPLY